MGDIPLQGGIANAGAVVRSGNHVLRPSSRHTESVHTLLEAVRASGFHGVPRPIRIEPDGRERLEFIEGEVPVPPYPAWSQADEVLTSISALLRSFHDALAASYPKLSDLEWSDELADVKSGDVICHNDVCLENVVFRDGFAVALLDFEFAAPGRRAWDVAALARLCVPIDDPKSRARIGWDVDDGPGRLRLVADSYGLDADQRLSLIESLDWTMNHGGEFVRRRVEAQDPGFVKMWEEIGGMERYERRRRWWERNRHSFVLKLIN